MERRKGSRGSIDELALVKAAAWAWYQHGSGSEGRAVREYDLAMPKRAPKPSRYKIEAMKESEEAPIHRLSPPTSAPLSPFSTASSKQSEISLLDDYEIQRISKELDRYMAESSRAEYLKSFLGSDHRANNRVVSLSESGTSEGKSKQKRKNSRGFWMKYGAVCGSRKDDVVDGRSFKIAYSHGGRKNW
nr:uncharacterized protein LOC113699501 [Coffea arabica]XP_027076620.1 uncharacterized protein LOC113700383 [Coffea arabica]